MLKDLKPIKIPIKIGENETYLRYNMTARRYLEHYYPSYNEFIQKDTDDMRIDDILHLLRAGLIDSLYEFNEKFIDEGNFEKIMPTMATLGKILTEENKYDIMAAIVDAFISSLPVAAVGTENFQTGGQAE